MGEGQDAHAGCKMDEACANGTGASKTECFMEVFQKKYKCFIIYAFMIISLIELIYLVTSSPTNGSKEEYMNIISRFLNRTANAKL